MICLAIHGLYYNTVADSLLAEKITEMGSIDYATV